MANVSPRSHEVHLLVVGDKNISQSQKLVSLLAAHPLITSTKPSRSNKTITIAFSSENDKKCWVDSFTIFQMSCQPTIAITKVADAKFKISCEVDAQKHEKSSNNPSIYLQNYLPFQHLFKLAGEYHISEAPNFVVSFKQDDMLNRFQRLLIFSSDELQLNFSNQTKPDTPKESTLVESNKTGIKFTKNPGFSITNCQNLDETKKLILSSYNSAVIVDLPPGPPTYKNANIHVQFENIHQAERFMQELKSTKPQFNYKLTGYMELKVMSDQHKLLTCFINFKETPLPYQVRKLLPKEVVDFEISSVPNPKRVNQWFIHAEFETAAAAQKAIIPLMTSLKQLNFTNLVFPTKDFLTLKDKERGVSCLPKSQVLKLNTHQDHTQTFSEKFRAVDHGKFGFAKANVCREYLKEKFQPPADVIFGDVVFPTQQDINQALHGDTVEFCIKLEVLFDEKQRKEIPYSKDLLKTCRIVGQITSILNRNRKSVVGQIRKCHSMDNTFVLTPTLSNLPYFWLEDCHESFEPSQLYLADIESDFKFTNPRLFTSSKDNKITSHLELAMEQVFINNCIDKEEWCEEILSEVPPETATCEDFPEAYKNRRDFRSDCVYTIDPRTCRDMDDAVHIKHLPSGFFEIGVHIADVSFFVNPSDAPNLYDHAKRTSTSFYFPDRVYHMLPGELSANLCSLCPFQDRFTVSMTWKVDANMKIVKGSFWYGRGIIKSRAKLAYEDVQLLYNFYGEHEREPSVVETMELFKKWDIENAHLDNYVPTSSKVNENRSIFQNKIFIQSKLTNLN